MTDLLGGQVQVYFSPISESLQHVRAGKLRGLGVSTATRWEGLPDIPAIAEFVPGYEASTWYGIGAPQGTPAQIIDLLNMHINAGLADPKMKARVAEMGENTSSASPADFGKFMAQEIEKWGKMIRAANIKPD